MKSFVIFRQNNPCSCIRKSRSGLYATLTRMAARPSNRHGRIYLDQEGADTYQCSEKTAMPHDDCAVRGVNGEALTPSRLVRIWFPLVQAGFVDFFPLVLGSTKQSCVFTRRPAPATYKERHAEPHTIA